MAQLTLGEVSWEGAMLLVYTWTPAALGPIRAGPPQPRMEGQQLFSFQVEA